MKVTTFVTAAITTVAAFGAQAATLPSDWTVVGTAGVGAPNGVVTAPSADENGYYYVTTDGGPNGGGSLDTLPNNTGSTTGSTVTTGAFAAAAGETLSFLFNYVTSDGSGYADYGWARIIDAVTSEEVSLLFTARTTPGGDTVPGFGMPTLNATLEPASTPIIDGGPAWDALGTDSGKCFNGTGQGCGYTGWIKSTFNIVEAGNYKLQFGISNWSDTAYQSGMAFAGAKIGDVIITPPVDPAPVPLPASALLLIAGMGALGVVRGRKAA